MVPNLKNFLFQNLDLIFISLFLVLTLSLLWVPPIWDENVYLNFDYFPLNPTAKWVPHPPLLWYLLALSSLVPRMAILMCSLVCLLFLFYACKRLYGTKIARLAVVILANNWLYMLLGSLVMFTDGPVTAFMTISTVSFLCWLKLDEQKFLLISGLGLALASLTKYTAAPIILITSFVWLVILEKRLELAKILKMLGVAAVSLLPLLFWIFRVYQTYGNFVGYYSTLYGHFPSARLLAVFSPLFFVPFNIHSNILVLAFNLGYYALCTFVLANVYLLSWVKHRQFDLDSKLLLAHIAIIFLFFVIISREDIGNFRYLLPMAPSIAIISAKNMIKEKSWLLFLTLFTQFVGGFIITYVSLVLYPLK